MTRRGTWTGSAGLLKDQQRKDSTIIVVQYKYLCITIARWQHVYVAYEFFHCRDFVSVKQLRAALEDIRQPYHQMSSRGPAIKTRETKCVIGCSNIFTQQHGYRKFTFFSIDNSVINEHHSALDMKH
jgi:hypothetical protein